MRVLIIGMYYSPEVTGNAPYTAGLAEHLAARGDSYRGYYGSDGEGDGKAAPPGNMRAAGPAVSGPPETAAAGPGGGSAR